MKRPYPGGDEEETLQRGGHAVASDNRRDASEADATDSEDMSESESDEVGDG